MVHSLSLVELTEITEELGTTLQDAQMRDQEVHLVAILGTIVWTQTYE